MQYSIRINKKLTTKTFNLNILAATKSLKGLYELHNPMIFRRSQVPIPKSQSAILVHVTATGVCVFIVSVPATIARYCTIELYINF